MAALRAKFKSLLYVAYRYSSHLFTFCAIVHIMVLNTQLACNGLLFYDPVTNCLVQKEQSSMDMGRCYAVSNLNG